MNHIHFKVDRCNNPSAPWLIFVNGLLATLESWDEHVNLLSNDFNILRYDGLGQGKSSDINGSIKLSDQVNVLNDLLQDQNISKANFVGLSNGARVTLEFSTLYTDKIDKQIIVAGYAKVDRHIQSVLESWRDAHLQGGADLRFSIALPWIWGKSTLIKNQSLIPLFRKLAKNWKESNVLELINSGMSGDIDLSKIKSKTLYLTGEEDLLTPIKLQNEMHESTLGSNIELMAGGHACLLEHPIEAAQIIRRYLLKENFNELDLISRQ
ncbi:MAG: alpha/beta hydrolase [Bacteriovoracaceae bacterium]|nr:alpha/beta hydrolase [Bacteriovoracaceae bacterium]